MAWVYGGGHQFDLSILWAEKALAQDPEHLAAHGIIGDAAVERGDNDKAFAHYQAATEVLQSIEALAALGDIIKVRGDVPAAEEYYAKVEALHRTHRETGLHDHMEMARFYADHDRSLPEALRLAQEHGQTGNLFEADTFAWLYFKNGDQPKAIEWIKTALKANLPDAAVHYHAGCIAAAAGDRASAEKHLQQALSQNPHFSLLLASDASARLAAFGENPPAVPLATATTAPPTSGPPPLRALR